MFFVGQDILIPPILTGSQHSLDCPMSFDDQKVLISSVLVWCQHSLEGPMSSVDRNILIPPVLIENQHLSTFIAWSCFLMSLHHWQEINTHSRFLFPLMTRKSLFLQPDQKIYTHWRFLFPLMTRISLSLQYWGDVNTRQHSSDASVLSVTRTSIPACISEFRDGSVSCVNQYIHLEILSSYRCAEGMRRPKHEEEADMESYLWLMHRALAGRDRRICGHGISSLTDAQSMGRFKQRRCTHQSCIYKDDADIGVVCTKTIIDDDYKVHLRIADLIHVQGSRGTRQQSILIAKFDCKFYL